MPTMNKPASNDPDWYNAVTANWNAVENNIIDKSTWAAKGDLIAASAPSAPTRVAVGANNTILQADKSSPAGIKWVDSNQARYDEGVLDMLWGKKFFSDEGLLPSGRVFEYFGTPPAFDGLFGQQYGGWVHFTREPGVVRPNFGGLGFFDLGSAKSKVLIVVGTVIKLFTAWDNFIQLLPSPPVSQESNGYWCRYSSSGPEIYKVNSGPQTRIDTSTGIDWTDPWCGCAFYFNGVTNVQKVFLRMSGQWFLAQSASDSAFTTVRYVAFSAYQPDIRWATPYVAYAE